jgi:transposase
MDHFAGLDVSVKETSVCIVDDTGRIVREVKVTSEPETLLQVLTNPAYRFKRIGLEAGPLSQWLYSVLIEAGLPVICVETRHMRAVLKAQINKTDRNDARGIAQMMRVGLYRPVHVKTLRSQKLRMLLTHRNLLQSKAIAVENDLRGTLRNFGLKVGVVGKVKFEARIKELVENLPDLAVLVETLLIVRRVLREQLSVLHRRLLAVVRDDDVCRRLMTVPGVGPVVALTYRTTVDVPARFRNSKAVGAVFGLTPSKYQSGESDRMGSISKCGDAMMRTVLFEAAQTMLTRTIKWSWLKAWGMKIARHRGMKRARSPWHGEWQLSCTACGLTAPNSGGRGKKSRRHESRAGSDAIGENSSSAERWNDVPRGTMDEVSSLIRLDLPLI